MVGSVRFLDLSTAVLVSSTIGAVLLTAVFLGAAYSLIPVAAGLFGYAEAGVIWLMVLAQAIIYLGFWLLGKFNLEALAGSILRVYHFLCLLYGLFLDVTYDIFSLPWLSWATICFLLGTTSLAAANIVYYFGLA